MGVFYECARKIDKTALGGNFADVEKHAAESDEKRLLAFRWRQHVKTIRCDIMRCGTECQQPEENNRPLDKMRRGNRQRDAGQPEAEKQLHGPNPLPPCFEQIHRRTPQRFDDPWQIKQAREKRRGFVRHAEVVVEHHRHRGHKRVRHSFGEIKRRNPKPRASAAPKCIAKLFHPIKFLRSSSFRPTLRPRRRVRELVFASAIRI